MIFSSCPKFLCLIHSTVASWALHLLSLRPQFQSQLRTELRSLPLPSTTTSEADPLEAQMLSTINALPLLDAVVRETLRLYPPGTGLGRVAVKDDVIPLGRPVMDRRGMSINSIRSACQSSITSFPKLSFG
jgi:hypothetical protein